MEFVVLNVYMCSKAVKKLELSQYVLNFGDIVCSVHHLSFVAVMIATALPVH